MTGVTNESRADELVSAAFPSPSEWSAFLDELDRLVGSYADHVVLSCGCVVSQSTAHPGSPCPSCGTIQTRIVGPVETLRQVHSLVRQQRRSLGFKIISSVGPVGDAEMPKLLPAAPSATGQDRDPPVDFSMIMPSTDAQMIPIPKAKGLIDVVREAASRLSTSSNTDSSQSSASTTAIESWINTLNLEPVTSPLSQGYVEDDFREYNYSKSFPVYRKQFIHPTQPRTAMFLGKSAKLSFVTAITPDCTKFCLANRQRWTVYAVLPDFNDAPVVLHSEPVPELRSHIESQNGSSVEANAAPMLSMNNEFLAVATSQGAIRVYALNERTGEFPLVYSYQSPFGIHCLALSPKSAILAYSIIGRDKVTRDTQPIIMLHCPATPNFESVMTVSYTSPYRDPIKGLMFSSDEVFLACCTYSESRFMVISVVNLHAPRLVMKSSRRVDVSPDYEGVTAIQFFPGNSRYMSVTSVAQNAPPVLLDTKCTPNARSFNSGSSGLSHPTVLMRVDKVGSAIHKAEISPRGDAVAFLDKCGLVYLMHAPGMLSDMRKITIVSEVAGATNGRMAASMRFTPSGHSLLIVDRKGNLHIEDFGAGIPHQAGMGKCRILG